LPIFEPINYSLKV